MVDLAKQNGFIYYTLKNKNFQVMYFTPSEIKKFATGNGRAKKEDMLKCIDNKIVDMFKNKYKKIDDLVDAYWIAKLVLQRIKNGWNFKLVNWVVFKYYLYN